MMAQTIPCDLCHEEGASFLFTAVATGDVQGIGMACLLEWGESFLNFWYEQAGIPRPIAAETAQEVAAGPPTPGGEVSGGSVDAGPPPAAKPAKATPRKRTAKPAAEAVSA